MMLKGFPGEQFSLTQTLKVNFLQSVQSLVSAFVTSAPSLWQEVKREHNPQVYSNSG